ncbi:hypothetical protein E1301_Tti022974 [Triplophysa tibetana]|uniref:Uncharacterized protein n=1 Tax=Triplophysa tibetana TaxID=1572043 RepID=A0A5A9P0H6_9TELE|nr:hypothetical protein E1301_Tti022974 [Triplophysa tibetana]
MFNATVQDNVGNITPCGENGFTNGIHVLELTSVFVNIPCRPSPNHLNGIKIIGTCKMVQKSGVILREEVLCQTGPFLLKDPIITAQTWSLSQEGCPLKHFHIASHSMTEKAPQIMMELCHVENISSGISLSCNVGSHQDRLGQQSCHVQRQKAFFAIRRSLQSESLKYDDM